MIIEWGASYLILLSITLLVGVRVTICIRRKPASRNHNVYIPQEVVEPVRTNEQVSPLKVLPRDCWGEVLSYSDDIRMFCALRLTSKWLKTDIESDDAVVGLCNVNVSFRDNKKSAHRRMYELSWLPMNQIRGIHVTPNFHWPESDTFRLAYEVDAFKFHSGGRSPDRIAISAEHNHIDSKIVDLAHTWECFGATVKHFEIRNCMVLVSDERIYKCKLETLCLFDVRTLDCAWNRGSPLTWLTVILEESAETLKILSCDEPILTSVHILDLLNLKSLQTLKIAEKTQYSDVRILRIVGGLPTITTLRIREEWIANQFFYDGIVELLKKRKSLKVHCNIGCDVTMSFDGDDDARSRFSTLSPHF